MQQMTGIPEAAENHIDAAEPVAAPKVRTYRLKFQDEGMRPSKDVEFDAVDANQALIIAKNEARRRSAELWCEGKKLCTIRQHGDSFWEVRATPDFPAQGRQTQ